MQPWTVPVEQINTRSWQAEAIIDLKTPADLWAQVQANSKAGRQLHGVGHCFSRDYLLFLRELPGARIGMVRDKSEGTTLVPDQYAMLRWKDRRMQEPNLVIHIGGREIALTRPTETIGTGRAGTGITTRSAASGRGEAPFK